MAAPSVLCREANRAAFERGDARERFEVVSLVKQALVAGLEGFLDGDADAGDLRAGFLDELREAECRLAVGEEVIDDQDILAGWQELLSTPSWCTRRRDACRWAR